MNQIRARLLGLAATVAILVLVVGTPAILVAIGAAPWRTDISELGTLLTSPDDGTLAMVVIGLVAWIAWAVVVFSVLIEAVSRLRGLPAPSIPGFGVPQRAAGQLVAAAGLLFIAVPATAFLPPPPVHAAVLTQTAPEHPRLGLVAESLAPDTTASTSVVAAEPAPSTIDYAVRRGDSLWRIAEQHLGDGARYVEIVDLNKDVLNGRPDFIASGTVLKVPHEEVNSGEDEPETEAYIVKPGDTLSEIAQDELGDPRLYPDIYEASRHSIQPDGAKLVDPDLIRPGWKITIPDATPSQATEVEPPHTPEEVPPSARRPVAPSLATAPPSQVPAAETQGPTAATGTTSDTDRSDDSDAPAWLLPGLAGAGALLAGSIFLTIRSLRRTQLRYRRPGQTLVPPPRELRPVEKSAFVSGAPMARTIPNLDWALRQLAALMTAEGQAMPRVKTVELTGEMATLHLGEDASLPTPWEGGGSVWSVDLSDALPNEDELAPYPMLVSVGQDAEHHLWLANLEDIGILALGGDKEQATALGRHIAAELALNPWSVLVEVDTIGLGDELAAIDPFRLHTHTADDTQFIEAITIELTDALDRASDDPDPFHVVVASNAVATEPLVSVIRSSTTRLGAAVVAVTPGAASSAATFTLGNDGRLSAPNLGLELTSAGLTPDEAAACAAIVDLTRDAEVAPTPAMALAADDWRQFTDQGGALREGLTNARGSGPAGDSALLPREAGEYEDVAATTVADVESLAPVVSEQVLLSVEEADPTLDDDVTAWFDPDCRLPRLVLLGPVIVHAHGNAIAVAKRRPYFVELLTFLALHPEGATARTISTAFGIVQSRARTDIGFVRDWLGVNPRTGHLHLPLGTSSFTQTGSAGYQVDDLLVDLDLFRRLRARGEARGADGMTDLVKALQLVSGQPFEKLRNKGWGWLLDEERLHETMACAVVDTAHIVVVDALARGDLAQARSAADTACHAAPHDEVSRLDLVKVLREQGHDKLAERMLSKDVFNRRDDYMAPIELPERTREIVDKQAWGHARRPPTATRYST